MIVGQSDDPKRVYQLVVELMSNKTSPLNEDAFLRAKKKEMGRFLMGLNSVEFIANNLTDLYFQGFYLMDYLDLLSETTFEDLLERFERHFSSGESVLSVIWPEGMVK
jgi:predicted Zn-dependent peptidase